MSCGRLTYLQDLQRSMKAIEGEQSALDKALDQLEGQVRGFVDVLSVLNGLVCAD